MKIILWFTLVLNMFVSPQESWPCCLQSCGPLYLREKTSPVQHDRPQLHSWWNHTETRTWCTLSWKGPHYILFDHHEGHKCFTFCWFTDIFLFPGDPHKRKSSKLLLWTASLTIHLTPHCRCGWMSQVISYFNWKFTQQYRIKHKKQTAQGWLRIFIGPIVLVLVTFFLTTISIWSKLYWIKFQNWQVWNSNKLFWLYNYHFNRKL